MTRDPHYAYLSTCPLDGTAFGYDDPDTVPSIMLAPDGALVPEGGPVPEGSARHALCPGCVEAIKKARAKLGKGGWPRTFVGG